MLTIEDVMKSVQDIQDCRADDEAAHSMEDDLHIRVLKAVADGNPNAVGLAAAALTTLEISFARWCA